MKNSVTGASFFILIFACSVLAGASSIPVVRAAGTADTPGSAIQPLSTQSDSVNLNSSSFSLVVCQGPAGAPGVTTPCDFNGIMLTIQHLINALLVAGVFGALIGFCYMGFLFMTGKEKDRESAKGMLPKIFIGFILMLSGWFIVYQILSWLTTNAAFKSLLGSPS